MKISMKKAIMLLVASAMVLGVAGTPKVVRAGEDDWYPVDLTDGQEHDIDVNIIGDDFYDNGVRFTTNVPINEVEIHSYYNGGFYDLILNDDIQESATVDVVVDSNWDYPMDWVKAKQDGNKIVVKRDFTRIDRNIVVLDEGESKTLYRSDFSGNQAYTLAHLGEPTKEERVSQRGIRADGSDIDGMTVVWYPGAIWPERGGYTPGMINCEPFRSTGTTVQPDGSTIDNWRGESWPAAKVTVKYTRENGYEVIYYWEPLQSAPATTAKEVPAEVKEAQSFLKEAINSEDVVGLKGEANPQVQVAVRSIYSIAYEKLIAAVVNGNDVTIAGLNVSPEELRTNELAQRIFYNQVLEYLGVADKVMFCDGGVIAYVNADGSISYIDLGF